MLSNLNPATALCLAYPISQVHQTSILLLRLNSVMAVTNPLASSRHHQSLMRPNTPSLAMDLRSLQKPSRLHQVSEISVSSHRASISTNNRALVHRILILVDNHNVCTEAFINKRTRPQLLLVSILLNIQPPRMTLHVWTGT